MTQQDASHVDGFGKRTPSCMVSPAFTPPAGVKHAVDIIPIIHGGVLQDPVECGHKYQIQTKGSTLTPYATSSFVCVAVSGVHGVEFSVRVAALLVGGSEVADVVRVQILRGNEHGCLLLAACNGAVGDPVGAGAEQVAEQMRLPASLSFVRASAGMWLLFTHQTLQRVTVRDCRRMAWSMTNLFSPAAGFATSALKWVCNPLQSVTSAEG